MYHLLTVYQVGCRTLLAWTLATKGSTILALNQHEIIKFGQQYRDDTDTRLLYLDYLTDQANLVDQKSILLIHYNIVFGAKLNESCA